jgi:hypothetical protein
MTLEQAILGELEAVEGERVRRAAVPGLGASVEALKAYQQQRFAKTYPDLLASERYGAAARFFLEELYGPRDFTGRDRQFARIVPTLVRLFPTEVVRTVERLARLHGLSEQLDSAMAESFADASAAWDARRYVQAWVAVGRPEDRRRQIAWTLEVGRSLDDLVGKPLLSRSLRLMRAPAQVAGLGDLQRFLEAGFEAFRAMRGASGFLRVIAQREEALLALLFDPRTPDLLRTGDGEEGGKVEAGGERSRDELAGILGQFP